jgi:hypothetical protein
MKKTLLVIGLVVGSALALRAKGLFTLADNLRIFMNGLGQLRIKNKFLEVPFKVQVDNNSDESVKVDRVLISIAVMKHQEYVLIGSSSPDAKGFTLEPNKSHNFTFTPKISLVQLATVLGGDLLANLFTIIPFLQQQRFKIEIKLTALGKELVEQMEINKPTIKG